MSNNNTVKIKLKGAMDLMKKSKYLLAPISEAITNSLEAISQRGVKSGKIDLSLYFTGLLDEAKELEKVVIKDNGAGFDVENFGRFETLLDNTKGFNNRGSGRVQFLHRFGKIAVDSTYEENGKFYRRKFEFDEKNFLHNQQVEVIEDSAAQTGTTLILSHFTNESEEKGFYDHLEVATLKEELLRKFLLRFYLDKEKNGFEVPTVEILFFKNDQVVSEAAITAADIPAPSKQGELIVPHLKIRSVTDDEVEWEKVPNKDQKIKWAHFKLPEKNLAKNAIYLCSKDVPVEEIAVKEIKKTSSYGGYRYITGIYGDIFDDERFVSHSVDSFQFPLRKDVETSAKGDLFFDPEKEFLFMDEIDERVKAAIPEIYDDVFKLQEKKVQDVEAIAIAHGISIDIAKSANIEPDDNEKKITEKLYKKQAEHNFKQNYKIKKIFDSLEELNPIDDSYEKDLKDKSEELLNLIPQQNKEELGRYVIRRDMVTKVLGKILDKKLNVQKDWTNAKEKGEKIRADHEGLIHNLVFRKKSKASDGLNELWILNEEFIHFNGCSELPIEQIADCNGNKLIKDGSDELVKRFGTRTTKRPDVFLYLEEGKCILIEFKAPEVNVSEHLDQLRKYCTLIANCGTSQIDTFYCYLIGENIDPIDLPGDYLPSIYGGRVKPHTPINSVKPGEELIRIANAYTEVLKLSSMYERALKRNQSFAEKLGIRVPEHGE